MLAVKSAVRTVAIFVGLFIVVLALKAFVVQPYTVSGSSMEPTYHNGDKIVVEKLGTAFFGPDRKDVVIFKEPGSGVWLVKRVIGLPGDVVVIKGCYVEVDSEPLIEVYISKEMNCGGSEVNYTVPAEHVYVLGDNRFDSRDSRYFGAIPISIIEGEVVFTLPF